MEVLKHSRAPMETRTPLPHSEGVDYKALFLTNLDRLEKIIHSIARRHALNSWDHDDFRSWVFVRLLERDYSILRKFQGRAAFSTYLTTVVHNLYRDFRDHRWGRWRPSAAAKRHGDLGVQLESLLHRDGLTFQEAQTILRENLKIPCSPAELEQIAGDLRPRVSRRLEGEDALASIVAPERTGQRLEEREQAESWQRDLSRGLRDLPPEDRLILKLHYDDGLSWAAVARSLSLSAQSLYRRHRRLLERLRRHLTASPGTRRRRAATPGRPTRVTRVAHSH